jgi:hypothetical protein
MYRKKKTARLSRDDKSINGPAEFRLEQNSPNPFNTQTIIRFSVPRQCDVKLVVYNLREELLCILHQGQLTTGRYIVDWQGMDAEGQRLKNGSYVYRLEADGFVATRRLKIGNE